MQGAKVYWENMKNNPKDNRLKTKIISKNEGSERGFWGCFWDLRVKKNEKKLKIANRVSEAISTSTFIKLLFQSTLYLFQAFFKIGFPADVVGQRFYIEVFAGFEFFSHFEEHQNTPRHIAGGYSAFRKAKVVKETYYKNKQFPICRINFLRFKHHHWLFYIRIIQ